MALLSGLQKGREMKKNGIYIVIVLVLMFGVSVSAYADEAMIGLDLKSAYIWRGITRSDNPVLQPSMNVTIGGFSVDAMGNIDLDGCDRVQNHGLFTEVDVTLSYEIEVDTVEYMFGWIEYMFQDGIGNTREIYGKAKAYITDQIFADIGAYYDIDERKDIYLRSGLGVVFDLGDSLEVVVGCSVAAAGNDMSPGDDGGLHDYSFSLGVTHGAGSLCELALEIVYTNTMDEDVLPEQEVDVYAGAGIKLAF